MMCTASFLDGKLHHDGKGPVRNTRKRVASEPAQRSSGS